MPASAPTHRGPITHLVDAFAWLRGANTRRHVEAARNALDRVDTALDGFDEAAHLAASHLEHHHD